ncbi:EamA family transporter RarD [Ruegeria lacuscaerulensis]|uniref:EamA family transporter RarD n=1 Tax=Ruegeria lacuscaerulensis TaxID=55218 RepID=UPI001EEF3E29|nr:EamA family transporter RarD [Ruegeria lacuscaerulensis]
MNREDTPKGLALAVTAYVLWGFLPLYMKAMADVGPVEIVAHRIIWSVPVAGALLVVLGRTQDLKAALRNPKMLGMACLTAALISVNWAIYVWAIASGNALDAALGYYINPLFSIALGAVLLREPLNRAQLVAVGLAATGVLVLIWQAGSLPWAALGLMVSWGFYAFFKRSLPIGPNQGFLLEVLILLIPALVYVTWLGAQGTGRFGVAASDTMLLLGCGIVTAIPLLVYANGAKLVRLSTMGILQYIAPTMIFITAITMFGEQIDQGRMIAFPMIWAALVIYSIPMIRQMRAQP